MASRTHYEVLSLRLEGQVLGLEASSHRKLPCPWLEDCIIFCTAKLLLDLAENLRRPFLFLAVGDRMKNYIIIINGQQCKPGPAPRGAFRGRPLQMTACAPPNKNCAPQARTVPRRN